MLIIITTRHHSQIIMAYDIISIGSATRDVFMSGEELEYEKNPKFTTGEAICIGLGSKIAINKLVFTSGGGGTNAAVTFARQGLNTACIGVIGNDLNGDEILKELGGEGVNASHFQRHNDDFTAYSVVLVHKSGERSILSYKGEGQHFKPEHIPFDKVVSKWLYLDSLGGVYGVLERSVQWATENNVKIASNPGGKELAHGLEKLKPLLSRCAVFSINQEEAAQLTGIDYKNETEIFKFMDKLIDGIFVMTKGHDGVVVSDGKNVYSAGTPDSPVVERTGAGDAFCSGFVVEYIKGQLRREAVGAPTVTSEEIITKAIQFATANASSVVTEYGAKAGILKKDDWGPWELVKVDVRPL